MRHLISFGFVVLICGLFACGKKNPDTKENGKDSVQTRPSDSNRSQLPRDTSSKGNYTYASTDVDEGVTIDPNASPKNVVMTLIRAGKTGKYTEISKLCNQAVAQDGDAKDICNIMSASTDDQKDFNEFFGNATIVGEIRMKKGLAEVDIETTAEGGDKETITVQQKYGKWYLKGL